MTEPRSFFDDRGDASELLDLLYAAAVEPEFWPTFGSLLGRRLNARVNLHAGEPIGERPPPHPSTSFLDSPDPAGPTLPALDTCSEQDVLSETELVPGSPEQLLFERMSDRGFAHALFANCVRRERSATVVSACRTADQGPFGPAERRLVRRLTPHLARALQVRRTVHAARVGGPALIQALERARLGIIVTDVGTRPVFMNTVANTHLAEGRLLLRNWRVAVEDATGTGILHQAVAAAAGKGVGRSINLNESNGPGVFNISISPHTGVLGAVNAVGGQAILVIESRRTATGDCMQQAYGLTPAETSLLTALVRGERLADYAERTDVKLSTVKTHLRSLFAKTGEQRQADLIRRALSDPELRPHAEG